jgi:hypothetical protein
MRFRRESDIEWRMIADNGHDTGVTIADLRAEGFGFVVNWEGNCYGNAKTPHGGQQANGLQNPSHAAQAFQEKNIARGLPARAPVCHMPLPLPLRLATRLLDPSLLG